ncbi:MAG TPA: ribonuclease III [Clostridiales bacterium]|nr:ribonuclease III [Clostridiales bacterium]HCU55921.1 ribonuclease III [Clostridiales bacterium]
MLIAPIDKNKVKQMNPLVLAFVGDGVETLHVRTRVALKSEAKAAALHKQTAGAVNAHAQSEQAERILPYLTEEESEIYHRARNSKSHHHAKNYSVTDYRRASGLEAVIGYLYLTGQEERLSALFDLMEKI